MMMKSNRLSYRELSKAEVSESRNIVISNCSKGGFTIAQQLVAREDGDKITTVFMKGAFHVDNIHGLYSLRDAVNLAIQLSEEEAENPTVEEDDEWDNEDEGWE